VNWIHIVVLAVVQGLTEILPVSSSGHLILVPSVLGWVDQGLAFDVAVHFGTLGAVCLYFWDDIKRLVRGGLQVLRGKNGTAESKLALSIAVGTIPAAVAGLLFAGWIAENLRDPMVVVTTLTVYGILLAAADRFGKRNREMAEIGLGGAVVIGVAQALSLVPGTSRSGVTITAGLMLGYKRQDAARFSFLLSAPVILLAAIYEAVMLVVEGGNLSIGALAGGASISGLVAFLTIGFFMRFVNAIGLLPFAIYRFVLAGVIVYVLA
jgi:undecaprenyl-diphosphatase